MDTHRSVKSVSSEQWVCRQGRGAQGGQRSYLVWVPMPLKST